jgi:DNA-binding transcriptional LysR family regulator
MQRPRHENRLPHLETFCLAAELGSFTAAARAVGITQAAVSQRMHALERRLGVALFQRRAGRLQLTQAGEKLYEYAQRLRWLEQEAVARVTGCRAEQSGGLRIGTGDSGSVSGTVSTDPDAGTGDEYATGLAAG